MAANANSVEKLILSYPQLLKIEGLSEVVRNRIGHFQYPIDYISQKWHKLGKGSSVELRAVFMSLVIELIKWHAAKKKRTPTIRYMNKIFKKGHCPELGYLIRKLKIFESSYNELLILSRCDLNRKYFKRPKFS